MAASPAFGSGLARGPDLIIAAEQAAADALAGLTGQAPDFAAVFVCADTPDVATKALERAAATLGAAHVIGCTTGGVIGGDEGVENQPSISVWAAALPGATIRAFHLEVLRTDAELAVLGMPDRRADEEVAILLADPWSFPVDGFISRTDQVMPGLGITGGLASGPGGPGHTRLLIDGRVVDRGAVGVLLGGDISVKPLVSQGCRPIGPTMVVTSAEGGRVLALAGQPAMARLEQIIAGLDPQEQTLATRGLQLGVALDEYADSHDRGDFLIRGIVGGDPDSGTIMVADEITVGQTVRFQVRDAAAADDDLRQLLEGPGMTAHGALLFSCNGRGAGLFGTADHDPAALANLPKHPAVAGFFAAGELGPVGGKNHLHTFTASMLIFG